MIKKLWGGGQKITFNNLYEDSLPVEVLIINLTNAEVVVGFYEDNSINNDVYLKPFEIKTFGGLHQALLIILHYTLMLEELMKFIQVLN